MKHTAPSFDVATLHQIWRRKMRCNFSSPCVQRWMTQIIATMLSLLFPALRDFAIYLPKKIIHFQIKWKEFSSRFTSADPPPFWRFLCWTHRPTALHFLFFFCFAAVSASAFDTTHPSPAKLVPLGCLSHGSLVYEWDIVPSQIPRRAWNSRLRCERIYEGILVKCSSSTSHVFRNQPLKNGHVVFNLNDQYWKQIVNFLVKSSVSGNTAFENALTRIKYRLKSRSLFYHFDHFYK